MSTVQPQDPSVAALLLASQNSDVAGDDAASAPAGPNAAPGTPAPKATAAAPVVSFVTAEGAFVPSVGSGIGGTRGPVLPTARAAAAVPDESRAVLTSMGAGGYAVPTGAMAYSLIMEALQKAQTQSQHARIAATNVMNSNAVRGALASIKEAVAKRSEAGFKLMTSLGAAGMSLSMGGAGAKLMTMQGHQTAGAAFQASAQSSSQFISAAGDAFDQNMGPGYQASQAQIEKGQADLQKSFFQQQNDSQSSSDKGYLDAINQALSLLQEYNRRHSDTLKAIAS